MTERRGFDEQLDDAKSDVVTLAARVCEQIARATQSILDGANLRLHRAADARAVVRLQHQAHAFGALPGGGAPQSEGID